MPDERKSVWVIRANVAITHLVTFDEDVTRDQAKEMFLNDDYLQIVDETDHEVSHVLWVGE